MFLSRKFKKIHLVGLVCLLVLFLTPLKVLADSGLTWDDAGSQNLFNIVDPKVSKVLRTDECEAYIAKGLLPSVLGVAQKTTGGGTLTNIGCKIDKAKRDGIVFMKDLKIDTNIIDTLGSVNNFIIKQRPLSTVDYIEDKVYALTGRVNAEEPATYFPGGTGYQLLEPIQAFWGWSANVVYSFLILIVIGIAFAIIFRQKIGGKEIVQIQSAIPSIALAMILVPLSYSISGLFIDLIGIGSNTVHAFFFAPGAPARSLYENRDTNTCDGVIIGTETTPTGTSDNPCDRGLYIDDSRFEWYNFNKIVDISDEVTGVASSDISGQGINSLFITVLIKNFLDLISGTTQTPAYWFGEILNTIVGILMIWVSARIAWRLLKKYITIILMPIISPFIFATIAIPGNSSKAIMNYLKTMGSVSAQFIVTYALFLIVFVFTSDVFSAQLPAFSRGVFVPPILGMKSIFESLPVTGSESLTSFMFGVIGVGIFFSIPSILDGVDKAIGVEEANLGFLKTPVDSIKDSWNVTTRTAPAFAARTGIAAGRLARNTAFIPGRAIAGVEDILDRARGRDPGVDSNTYRYRRRQSLANQSSVAQAAYNRAKHEGNLPGMALAQTRLAALGAWGEFAGSGVGHPGDADKAPKLEISGNEFILQPSQIRNILIGAGGLPDPANNNRIHRPPVAPGNPHPIVEYLVGNVRLTIEAKGDAKLFAPMELYLGTTREERGVYIYTNNILQGSPIEELIAAVNNAWTTAYPAGTRVANSPVLARGVPAPTTGPLPPSPIAAFFASTGAVGYMEYTDATGAIQASDAIQLRIGAGRAIDQDVVLSNKFDLNVAIVAVNAFDLFGGPTALHIDLASNGLPQLTDDTAHLTPNRGLQVDRRSFRVSDPARGLSTPGFRITVKMA